LPFILEKYQEGEDYCYVQNQFRSIRQDLLLQGLKNSFSVKVVEENIKISLANKDLKEYERLRVDLHELYQLLPQLAKEEFIFTSLLYLILSEDQNAV
jgi:hypothetical protein